MPENRIKGKKPLWLLIEKEIGNCQAGEFAAESRVATAKKIASALDKTGYNVSGSGGNWLQLTAAIKARDAVGRPFIEDFDKAVAALTLDSIQDTHTTAMGIISDLGRDWPLFTRSENRPDVESIVRDRRVDLAVARARELGGEEGIRFLIAESFKPEKIIETMGISDDDFKSVRDKVDAELAEIERVHKLLASVADAADEDKVKHLLSENVADELILEIGGFDQATFDTARTAMEAELAERKRKEEELAAKKAAEAAGPSLDEIGADDMLEYIESIREILDFADSEKEIVVMCEQSSIPKVLMEIAVSDPDKLDELEKQAEG
jgi:hypothetical protein